MTQGELDTHVQDAARALALKLGPRFGVVLLVGDLEQRLRVTSVGNMLPDKQRQLLRAVERSHDEGSAEMVVVP